MKQIKYRVRWDEDPGDRWTKSEVWLWHKLFCFCLKLSMCLLCIPSNESKEIDAYSYL